LGSTALVVAVAGLGLTGLDGPPAGASGAAGAGRGWVQGQELTASDPGQDDDFGVAAISGSIIVVGSPMHPVGKKKDQGVAYVFTKTSSGWNQTQELTASDGAAYDQFGLTVAMAGSTMLISAPLHAVGSNAGQGAVYVFNDVGGHWKQTQELTAPDGASQDHFGNSLAMERATAVVGALFHGDGAAYFFHDSQGRWTQEQEVTQTVSSSNFPLEFGTAVAISGNEALISAPDATVDGNEQQGAAFVYVDGSDGWQESQEIEADDGVSGQEFGAGQGFSPPVAISGTTAAVGAFYTNSFQGTTFVFTRTRTGWTQTQQLTPGDLSPATAFGSVVTLQGRTMLIGAQGDGAGQQGATYVYGHSRRTWTLEHELTTSNAAPGDMFGSSVSVDGRSLVIGAFHVDTQTGAAYLFTSSR
jgi:hypothetical protein